jgi:predicted DCC family thiol-disulfide oxidoreductase YuxK
MTMSPSTAHSDNRNTAAWLVYDGDCPFCSRYVTFVRLRKTLGQLELVNAREGGPIVDEIRQTGLDLDEGMVLKLGDRYLHGAECMHALALMSGPSDLFNRVNAALFRSPRMARFLYPILRAGRNATLRLLGRGKLVDMPRATP